MRRGIGRGRCGRIGCNSRGRVNRRWCGCGGRVRGGEVLAFVEGFGGAEFEGVVGEFAVFEFGFEAGEVGFEVGDRESFAGWFRFTAC
jgi:hypothetical protein